MMKRRRLWDLACPGLDAVLSTSFDADELLSIDRRFQSATAIPEHPGLPVSPALLVYAVAHRACHSDNPTSRQIESRLNAMHARLIEALAAREEVHVLATCYAAGESREDLAGHLWTLLSDPRPRLRKHDLFWVQGVMIRALLHWTGQGQVCKVEPGSP